MSITDKTTICQKSSTDFLVYVKDVEQHEAFVLADKISRGDERCEVTDVKKCDNVFSASSALPMQLIIVKCEIYNQQELNREYVLGRINS